MEHARCVFDFVLSRDAKDTMGMKSENVAPPTRPAKFNVVCLAF